MTRWKTTIIKDGLAQYQRYGMTIEIQSAISNGCYDLKMYNKKGDIVKTAFWHGQDMDIPDEVENEWTEYFGEKDFPKCLDFVDWVDYEEG